MIFAKKRYDYSKLAQKLSGLLQRRFQPETFYFEILHFLAETLTANGASFLIKEGGNFVVRQSVSGEAFAFVKEECFDFLKWLSQHPKIVTKSQLFSDPNFSILRKPALNFFVQLRGEVCLPLCGDEELFGLILLQTKSNSKKYDEEDRNLLEWIAPQVELAMKNTVLTEKIRLQGIEIRSIKELKGEILSNLSHELRTPLTGVLGFAQILAEEIDGTLNEEQKKHLDQILEGSHRLLKILSALLDLAKLEARQFPLNVEQFQLGPIISGVTQEISLNLDTTLEVELDSKTPSVYGDVTMVRQIFKHLLDNAAKYTHAGCVNIGAEKKGEMLEICVSDTGIGISDEKVERIFEEFYQGEGGLTRRYEGSGIGLSLSKKFIELHGGKIWVKSAPGRGSRFYFTLPLKPIALRHKELAA